MTKVLIVSARFYEDLSAELEKGAEMALKKANVSRETIAVPGAFEIPSAIAMAIASKKYSGYVALGCVIRGETTHYDYVCGESARGLMNLAVQYRIPLGYGILTCENHEQAWERARIKGGNKGGAAAEACLEMLKLSQLLTGSR